MTASGGRMAASASASSTEPAVATSYPAPRRFVVRARRICGSSSTTRILDCVTPASFRAARREREDECRAAPLPFVSAQRLPPFSSANPRAIASPSPVSPPEALRQNGWNTDSASAAEIPGPSSETRITTVSSCAVAPMRTCPPAPACRCAFSSRLTRIRCACPASTMTGGRSAGTFTDRAALVLELVERRADDLVDRPELALRIRGAGLEPREIEQVAHHPVEASGLDHDRVDEGRPVALVELELRIGETSGSGRDRGQRRSQVVGDRPEHVRLDRIASPQRLGLECLSLELLAIDRDGEERRQCREEPPHHLAVGRPRCRRRERTDAPSVDLEGEAPCVGQRRRPVSEGDPRVIDAENGCRSRGYSVELARDGPAAEQRGGNRRKEARPRARAAPRSGPVAGRVRQAHS